MTLAPIELKLPINESIALGHPLTETPEDAHVLFMDLVGYVVHATAAIYSSRP